MIARKWSLMWAVVSLLSAAHAQDLKISAKSLSRLDAAWAQSIGDFNVPSMAVAVVHKGEIVWAKGYGVADMNTGAAADENTLYAVASNTKAFTAAALAILVDEGKIAWDDRVREHWPAFTMYDSWVTDHMTIRDLLCHRSGLKTFSGDLLWYGTSHSAEDVLDAMRHLEPTFDFRAGYGYSNLMYMVAGKVIEEVSGQTWSTFIQQHLLDPVGMSRARLTVDDLAAMENVAAPHNDIDGTNTVIDWVNWDNMAPAGALLASASDMAQWMITQLDSGRVGTERIWSEARTREMWTLHNSTPVSSWYNKRLPSMHFKGFGLGWETYDLHGRQIVAHSGGYDGMISRQVLVPEEELGLIFLTNNITSLSWAWGHDALNALLDGDFEFELVAEILEGQRAEHAAAQEEQLALEAARVEGTSPALPLAAYAGTYRDITYGDIVIEVDSDRLSFDFLPTDLFRGKLSHWHFNTFRLSWDTQMMLPQGFAHFEMSQEGEVVRLLVDVPNPDFHFTEHTFEKLTPSP